MKRINYANFGSRELEFPAVIKISFSPLFLSLRTLAGDGDASVAAYAVSLLTYLEDYPELEAGFTDYTLLKTYEPAISKLLRILFPDVLLTNEIKGVTAPFSFQPFYMSTRFSNILKAAGDHFEVSVMNFSDDEIYIFVCCVILWQVYGYSADISNPFVLPIPDTANNLMHIYRVAFNADMIKAVPTDKAPPITKDDYALLIDNFTDIKIWKEKFPPESYVLSGIGIVNLMDVTIDHSVSGITTNLLEKSQNSIPAISAQIRTIFKNNNLQLGYINYENDHFYMPPDKSNSSILLDQLTGILCSEAICPEAYEQLIKQRQPLIITDTAKYQQQHTSKLSALLLKHGIESYIMIPLVFEDDFLGFIELASEKKYELSYASVRKLSAVLPVLSMALSHFKTEAKNELDAVIQQEFTKIHPSVRWRFEAEAWKYINARRNKEEALLEDFDFEQVYPLFGQLDIKGSSTIRNEVIQKDMNTQLDIVRDILVRANHKNQSPLYEELIYRIETHIKQINEGLLAGSEHDILYFLQKEITPVFDQLQTTDEVFALAIKKYNDQLDSQSKLVYHERRKFDESVGMVNSILCEHLDRKQEEAQHLFPHYFERYKTDGVEYNIYVGASIARALVFDKVHVQNLRLWQLIVMCELENEFFRCKRALPQPLEIASLIMVQSDPLTIHFRLDEKRFDVKGAYNARYEIIKSRIDKAFVKGSDERITLPGKLSIIYSNDADATEYIPYIHFLTAQEYLEKESLEILDVEDLQGITGLKALRVSIRYHHDEKKPAFSIIDVIGTFDKR